MLLKDKVAIITGASRGIGRATAVAFAQEGARLVLAARSVDDLHHTQRLVREKGGEAIVVPTDVGEFSSVENMTKESLRHYGRIDVLVNNAGVSPAIRGAERWTPEEWDVVIRTDLTGVFLCCLSVGRKMIEQKGGCILSVSSMGAEVPLYGQSAYCAAKAGVVQLTRALALEWAKYNVRLNCIAPGNFEIGIGEAPFKGKTRYYHYLLDRTPLGRFGRAEELTSFMTFLVSDAASYMTGQTVYVDGGCTAA